MKKTNILIIIAIILSGLFFWKWQVVNELKERQANLLDSLQYDNFIDLNRQINRISETLDMYEENFTDREKNLFRDSAMEDVLSLGRIGMQIYRVVHRKEVLINWASFLCIK